MIASSPPGRRRSSTGMASNVNPKTTTSAIATTLCQKTLTVRETTAIIATSTPTALSMARTAVITQPGSPARRAQRSRSWARNSDTVTSAIPVSSRVRLKVRLARSPPSPSSEKYRSHQYGS